MVASSPSNRFVSDQRGNHLADWRIRREGPVWSLLLRGSQATLGHVIACWPRAKPVGLRPENRPYWTHRLRLDFPPSPELENSLRLLQNVLILPIADVIIDGAIALDFYKQPSQEQHEYTDIGRIVYMLKYQRLASDETRSLGRTLCAALCDAVNGHPRFRDVTRLAPVPGHTSPLSIRIGSTLHRDLDIPITRVHRRGNAPRPVKDMTQRERIEQFNDFAIHEDLTGQRVLIVDDLYRTGRTLVEVAQVAHTAGAERVFGLFAARTLGSHDKTPRLRRWRPY